MTSGSRATRYVRRNTSLWGRPDSTEYHAYLHGDPDEQPSAALVVDHSPESTLELVVNNTRLNTARKKEGIEPIYYGETKEYTNPPSYIKTTPWHESGMIGEVDKFGLPTVRPAKENEQLQLFGYRPARQSHVAGLHSRMGMGAQISAMTLLGMADLDVRESTGMPLKTSDNLSRHSMRIVRHLGDAGAIPASDVPKLISNNTTFYEATYYLDNNHPNLSDQLKKKGAEDVTHTSSRARRHIGQMLKSGREKPEAKAETEKHTQLTLPGFD